MQKKIINVLQDDIYTILEFEDHTFLPLISINNLIMALIKDDSIKNDFIKNDLIKDKECIYCHRKNIKLCTLDNQHYLCLDCATKIVENFAQLGLPIDLNLGKINPKLISKLQKFISGNINVDKANFIVNTNNNAVNTNTFSFNESSPNNLSKKNNLINLQAQTITKRANIVHASAKILDKNIFDKNTFDKDTFDKDTLDKDTLDKDTLDKDNR